ncbi:hypothetical protein H2O64_12575 [Kordia sp. YSTF-M3]|uniref:Uncharacterized protein n=1 Tax=Kordia aestuariivivens TaxID=2759037 RepID=A0ABR7QAA6_9FLAO|nr:hypothetical protein [Kordia aestuariivivens]MBC8755504.1 hypothetical protein [Kordia aestuariivivens]
MKPIIKLLLDEFIEHRISHFHGSSKYHLFAKTNEALGETEIGTPIIKLLVRDILMWHKDLVHLAMEEEHDYEITVKDFFYENFKTFFKTCPELNLLFKMEGKVITYADSLTSEEIAEIRQYFLDNLEVSIRVTRSPK